MQKKLNLSVIKHSKLTCGLALVLVIASIVAVLTLGLNFGIDFVGGSIVQIDLKAPFELADVKAIFDVYDSEAQIVKQGDGETQVSISTKLDLTQEQRTDIVEAFIARYNISEADFSFDQVSASIGEELKGQAVVASLLAVACMLIYISFRFEFLFGVSSVVALVHDIVIVIGFYALVQMPVNSSFIAAMLTILGYSINNTIVIFDRIRSQQRRFSPAQRAELVDSSINSTLKRTINTSLTTLLAIGCVYLFGVNAVREFALPMIVGFVAGTYSSVFVAGPCWYFLKNKFSSGRKTTKKRR